MSFWPQLALTTASIVSIKILGQGTPQVLTLVFTLSNTHSQSHNFETVLSVSTGRDDGMQQLHV